MKAIIIGSGHNGLVAAILLARKGIEVTVVEERDMIGGAIGRPMRRLPQKLENPRGPCSKLA